MEQAKNPWQSRTMLLNGIFGLLAAVGLFVPGAEQVKLQIEAHATEIGMAWSLLNMALRAITKDAIQLKD